MKGTTMQERKTRKRKSIRKSRAMSKVMKARWKKFRALEKLNGHKGYLVLNTSTGEIVARF